MNKLMLLCMMFVSAANAGPWYPLGPTFGQDDSFRFGFDKSATLGACAEWNFADRRPEAGPCRDTFLLTRGGVKAAHIGGAIMFAMDDPGHARPSFMPRFGLNVGPAVSSSLAALAAKVPYLEGLANYRLPSWASYLGHITSVDGSAGWRPKPLAGDAHFPYGVQAKVDVPIEDLLSLLRGAP